MTTQPHGAPAISAGAPPALTASLARPISAGTVGAFHDRAVAASLPVAAKVRLLTGADNWQTHGHPGIGLRPMVTSDGPAGVRGTTRDERKPSASLPSPSALGATWDVDLVGRLAAALGAEAR